MSFKEKIFDLVSQITNSAYECGIHSHEQDENWLPYLNKVSNLQEELEEMLNSTLG